ncbi:MAG TPA: FAD-binding oxidoreductase [Clostridiaceae bacterium]
MNSYQENFKNEQEVIWKVTLKKVLYLLIYFLSPLIPILVIYLPMVPFYNSNPLYLVSLICGSAAFVWIAYEFILISKPKFIEKTFGLDKFYAFHGIMAIISVLLIFVHRTILEEKFEANTEILLGNLSFYIFIGITILALLLIYSTVILKLKPILRFKRFLIKHSIFTYTNQVLIHNIVICAYILMFIHVMLAPTVKGNNLVIGTYTLFFIIGALFYIYHTIIKKLLLRRNLYTVNMVIKESDNMWTLKLTPDNKKIFFYKPGQFSYIKVLGKSVKSETHPFSMSSSPLTKAELFFSVKALGDFTNTIGNVLPGEKVEVDGPYGKFSYLDYKEENSTIIIAGGVGITPVLSMLRYMAKADKNRNVILFWGINNTKDLICNQEILNYEKKMKGFHFIPVMFKEESWPGEKGIIDREKLERFLELYKVDLKTAGYYICGPGVMTDGVLKTLKSMNIKKSKLHFEKFS